MDEAVGFEFIVVSGVDMGQNVGQSQIQKMVIYRYTTRKAYT